MKHLIVALTFAVSVTAFADTSHDNYQCIGSCVVQSTLEQTSSEKTKKRWYCVAKDSCGKSYIPECGNTCFSHAVSEAERLCAEKSKDAETCEVIDAEGGSCSTDREELVRKSK